MRCVRVEDIEGHARGGAACAEHVAFSRGHRQSVAERVLRDTVEDPRLEPSARGGFGSVPLSVASSHG
jgi:hypothetical protein